MEEKKLNTISKYLAISTMALSAFTLTGCGGKKDSTKELAKKIESESTELIYSIESMDNVRLSDLAEEA